MKKIFVVLLFLTFGCTTQDMDETTFYISPSGNDSWSGRRVEPNSDMSDGPFATLEKARNTIREIKKNQGLPAGGITVWLRGGNYFIATTFELNELDSGTEEHPVVYRSYNNEEVRIIGGREIDFSVFEPVTNTTVLKGIDPAAKDNILQADLKKEGISDFGEMKMTGFTQPVLPVAMELFYNDHCMQIARWPNEGFSVYGEVTEAGSAPRYDAFKGMGRSSKYLVGDPVKLEKTEKKPGKFLYLDDRPSKWAGLNDVWLYGKWRWQWADETIRVASIDTLKKEITLSEPHHYGMGGNNTYYAMNILGELDSPGEYYIDRKTGILYFWPPSPIEQGRAVVSILDEPMIAMEGVSYVTIQGMILEASRGMGVFIARGSHNKIAGCTLRNLGTAAVCIGEGESGRTIGNMGWSVFSRLYLNTEWNRNGGTDNGVTGCNIYNTGAHGILLGGGDRRTLTPAGNYAINNHIHHFARWYNLNHPGISVDGVGNLVAHNTIHDALHSAIMFWGNDHIFEFNEIHHVLTSSGDAGAIYGGRDPSMRGNVIRNNFFHHIGEGGSQLDLHLGAWSVMLDDGQSGHNVVGNVFYRGGLGGSHRAPQTIQITGGHDNVIKNNIFVDCPKISHANAWDNEEWIKVVKTPLMQRRLVEAVDVTKPPYTTKYPKLADIFNESTEIIRQNLLIDNYETTIDDPCFVDGPNLDFRLKKDAEIFTEIPDFRNIPFGKIGLYLDKYRRFLPKD